VVDDDDDQGREGPPTMAGANSDWGEGESRSSDGHRYSCSGADGEDGGCGRGGGKFDGRYSEEEGDGDGDDTTNELLGDESNVLCG